MSVRKTLPLSAAAYRLVTINLFMVTLYNPSPLSAVALARSPALPVLLRLAVLACYAVILAALTRQAWCGFRCLGAAASLCLLVALAALLWTLVDLIDFDGGAFVAAGLFVLSIALGPGQVAAYYARQFSGQSPVLKHPP